MESKRCEGKCEERLSQFMPSKFNGPFWPVPSVQIVEKSSSKSTMQKIERKKKNEGRLERKKGGNYRPLAF